MPRTRVHNKTKNKFKKAMRNVVDNLGRQVKVYMPSKKSACPNCFYDKVANRSTGKCKWKTPMEARDKQKEYEISTGKTDLRFKFFKVGRCPICKNLGYLGSHRRKWVNCLVNWASDADNEAVHTPAGLGSFTLVRLKTDPKYLTLFNECVKIEVDGVTCVVSSPPTLRGLGNQTVLLVTAMADNKLGPSSGERLKDYN